MRVGLGRGVAEEALVRLGSGERVGEEEGVLVTGWNGVRVGLEVGVTLAVVKILIEIRRGFVPCIGRLDTVIQPRVIKLNNTNPIIFGRMDALVDGSRNHFLNRSDKDP